MRRLGMWAAGYDCAIVLIGHLNKKEGSAVLDEPVREEDSFSKESMSQESEISENILLPDLAKQSESIEQQSGEIAERGMPT